MKSRTLYLLRKCYAEVYARLKEVTAAAGLAPAEYRLLSIIAEIAPCSGADLARVSDVTPQAVTQQIRHLEHLQMIRRFPDGANRRIALVELTQHGVRALAACDAAADELERELFGEFADADFEAFRVRLTDIARRAPRGELHAPNPSAPESIPMTVDETSSTESLFAGKAVHATRCDGIAWVTLNRPEKRNAVSPTMNDEMHAVLDIVEVRDDCGVMILTGAGDSFSAGMDLKEYFRETQALSALEQARIRRVATGWMWRRMMHFPKPTIAMINGWCFGGAFTPLVACDLAFAADEAQFGLSEINWGIIPAGNVTRAVAEVMRHRDALYYIMTGETFDGRRAAEMGLVNRSVPLAELRALTEGVAKTLLSKNPVALRYAKSAFKYVEHMDWDTAEAMLGATAIASSASDPERGRQQGMKQFLDDKTYRPGLEGYRRDD